MRKEYLARLYFSGGTMAEKWFSEKRDADRWARREVVRMRGMIPDDPAICGEVLGPQGNQEFFGQAGGGER